MQEDSGITPLALQNRPILEAPLDHYYEVYREISRGRNYTMGRPLPLSFKDVKAYCEFFDISPHMAQVYYHYTLMIDNLWMDIEEAKVKAESKQKSGQNSAKVPQRSVQ